MPAVRGENVNRAGAAAAVRRTDRQAARQFDFEQRRLHAYRHVATEVNAGRMSPGQGHRLLQRNGFIPGGTKATSRTGRGPNLVAKTIADVAEVGYHAPGGWLAMGKAVGQDVGEGLFANVGREEWRQWKAAATKGQMPSLGGAVGAADLSLPHTRRLGTQAALAVRDDFRHPLRHPGYTLLDATAALGGGATAAGRIAAAGRAFSDLDVAALRANAAAAPRKVAVAATKTARDVRANPAMYGKRAATAGLLGRRGARTFAESEGLGLRGRGAAVARGAYAGRPPGYASAAISLREGNAYERADSDLAQLLAGRLSRARRRNRRARRVQEGVR